MKTVGEILKTKREEKKISLKEVEKITKIREKFLKALEEDDYEKLPPPTFIKGFIRNYSLYLGIEPDKTLAIFRREFAKRERRTPLPSGLLRPLNEPIFKITPARSIVLFSLFLAFLFFVYLFKQYQTLIGPPLLKVWEPQEGAVVYGDRIKVAGKADPEAKLTINNQAILLTADGNFEEEIFFKPGNQKIIITAENRRNGQKNTIELKMDVRSP